MTAKELAEKHMSRKIQTQAILSLSEECLRKNEMRMGSKAQVASIEEGQKDVKT